MIQFLAAILVSAAALAAASPVPSLAGKWLPDPQQSTSQKTLKAAADPNAVAPPAPPPGAADHPLERIEQSGSTIKITLHDPEGEPTNTLVLTPDGSEIHNPMSGGALQHVSRTRWEGESLVVEWKLERDGKAMIWGKDIRTLEGPGVQRLVRDLEDAKSNTHVVVVLKRE